MNNNVGVINAAVGTTLDSIDELNSQHKQVATATKMTQVLSALTLVTGVSAFVAGFFFPLCSWNPFLWMGLAGAAAICTLADFVASLFIRDNINGFEELASVSSKVSSQPSNNEVKQES